MTHWIVWGKAQILKQCEGVLLSDVIEDGNEVVSSYRNNVGIPLCGLSQN